MPVIATIMESAAAPGGAPDGAAPGRRARGAQLGRGALAASQEASALADPPPFRGRGTGEAGGGLRAGRRQNRSGGAILGEKAMRATLEWPGPKSGARRQSQELRPNDPATPTAVIPAKAGIQAATS